MINKDFKLYISEQEPILKKWNFACWTYENVKYEYFISCYDTYDSNYYQWHVGRFNKLTKDFEFFLNDPKKCKFGTSINTYKKLATLLT